MSTLQLPHQLIQNDAINDPKGTFQAAYRLAGDKRGYSFEYRIPWKTLGAKSPPRAGDIVAATMQINWARGQGPDRLRERLRA